MGYAISLIWRPETIVSHLLSTKADIVILNCPFGEMDRHAMTRTISKHPRLSKVHVIALVPETEATDADIFKAWHAGVAGYDKKPITKGQLAGLLALTTRSVWGEPIDDLIYEPGDPSWEGVTEDKVVSTLAAKCKALPVKGVPLPQASI
jgi:CheY-like chemotaxis protein